MPPSKVAIASLSVSLSLVAACSETPVCTEGKGSSSPTTHVLDFGAGSLTIANETVVFPLAQDVPNQALTESELGDLSVIYTRVGCWIDNPGSWLGNYPARDVPAVHLTRITIDQVTDGITNDALSASEETCFTYRTCDGTWHPLVSPTRITGNADASNATFDVDLTGANAVAIFLFTWTDIKRITYDVD